MKKLLLLLIIAAVLGVVGYMLTSGDVDLANLGAPAVPADWATSVGDGLTFSYPEALGTTYVGSVIWPPQGYLLAMAEPLSCEEGDASTGAMVKRSVDGREYCVTEQSEKTSSGSVFTQYAYAFEKEGQVFALIFGLRYLPCDTQEATEISACQAERTAFNIDTIADTIAQSFKVDNIEAAPDTSVVPEGA